MGYYLAVLNVISNKEKITVQEIIDELDISKRTVYIHLKTLLDEKVIEKVDVLEDMRSRYYRIKKNNNWDWN